MLIAITGGPATGKSTLHGMFMEMRPFVSYDSDAAVHELLAEDPDVIEAVTAAFGRDIAAADGRIDRASLRAKAFASPRSRETLEAILHPRVRAQWTDLMKECRSRGRDFLAEIPLLFETQAEGSFDCTVMVAASEERQRQRLATRGLDEDAIDRLLSSQLAVPLKVSKADAVVWNDGGPSSLRRQATLLLGQLFPSVSP